MSSFSEMLAKMNGLLPIIILSIAIIILIVIFNIVFARIKKKMLQRAKTKVQVSNIKIFSRILNISVILIIVMLGFLSYIKSWTGIGVALGLITAALGFALQKPITGVAAWLMVIFKRPFNVGDRITIAGFKGDVYDISLTHLYLDEIGTLADSEQHSGRNIMIPNYLLFEQTIINHTLLNDYVLNEITIAITYESNLDKAMEIVRKCADQLTKEYSSAMKSEAKVRLSLGESSVNLKLIYYAPVQKMSQIKTEIIKNIYHKIQKDTEVFFAYPHTEIVYKDKAEEKDEEKKGGKFWKKGKK